MTSKAPVWMLAGFFGLHLFNRFLTSFVGEKDPDKRDYEIGIGSFTPLRLPKRQCARYGTQRKGS
jgi:hypothetical protein